MSGMRGTTAIVGIGQTPYYKRGNSPEPELKLAIRAITQAADDAGIDVRDINGFVSYAAERSDASKLMPALGTRECTFASLVWFHGGALAATLNIAAGAIASGQADIVAVYRSMAEGNSQRLRVAVAQDDTSAQYLVNGLDSPAQILALRAQRLMEYHGVPQSALYATTRASYFHAHNNSDAYGRDIEITPDIYDSARMISEPYRLFDCSRENDGAACVLVVSAERARDLKQTPAYVLSAPMGTMGGGGALEENWKPYYATAGQKELADRLWRESGYGPHDVDVAQIYMNMNAMGIGSMVDHGFCAMEEVGDFCTFENLIAPSGGFPINTSGGDLGEGFIHGMGLIPEAVRQIRGTSTNQVPGAQLSLFTGGPGDLLSSTALLGSEATL